MTVFPRRRFLSTSAALAASAVAPWRPLHAFSSVYERDRLARHAAWYGTQLAELPSLLAAALDAARAAGAVYAEAHVRFTSRERWIMFQGTGYPLPQELISVGMGVRALVKGYWGFAGSDGQCTRDIAAQLARSATGQATIASNGPSRTVELAPTPIVNGTWTMPVAIDPFSVSLEEKADFIAARSADFMLEHFGTGTTATLSFMKDERTFASSEGSYTSQIVFRSGGTLNAGVMPDGYSEMPGGRGVDFLTPAGAGWEYLRTAPLRERMAHVVADALRSRQRKPVDVGRYDVVFDAKAMANILDNSLGPATGLERAMGYQANDAGTSYLNDPLAMLGTQVVASPVVSISANRSMAGGAATVQWDAEGVAPAEIPLVTKGVLTDFQTTRESASWLKEYYGKTGRPVRSGGCAGIYASTTSVTPWSPNFVLAPGAQDASFEEFVKQVKKGYAVVGGSVSPDQQVLNGEGTGEMVYEITNGTLGGVVGGAEFQYRAPEFWKNVATLGGAGSARAYGFEQWDIYRRMRDSAAHTVSAVPALVTGVIVTDAMRKV